MQTHTRNSGGRVNRIKVSYIIGISFIVILLWLLGILVWRTLVDNEECWNDIPDCIFYSSVWDKLGGFLGAIIVFYTVFTTAGIIAVICVIPYRFVKKWCESSRDVERPSVEPESEV